MVFFDQGHWISLCCLSISFLCVFTTDQPYVYLTYTSLNMYRLYIRWAGNFVDNLQPDQNCCGIPTLSQLSSRPGPNKHFTIGGFVPKIIYSDTNNYSALSKMVWLHGFLEWVTDYLLNFLRVSSLTWQNRRYGWRILWFFEIEPFIF